MRSQVTQEENITKTDWQFLTILLGFLLLDHQIRKKPKLFLNLLNNCADKINPDIQNKYKKL